MVDQPDDVPPHRRRSTSLPPFIAPLGSVGVGHANRPANALRTPSRTPTRLFTPPRAVAHTAQPVAPPPYAPTGGEADSAPTIAPVPPDTTPDAGDSELHVRAAIAEPWAAGASGVDTTQDLAAWEAECAEGTAGSERAVAAEGTVGAERVEGLIGASDPAEWMEPVGAASNGAGYGAEEPFVDAAVSEAAESGAAESNAAGSEVAVSEATVFGATASEATVAAEHDDPYEFAVGHEHAQSQETDVGDASRTTAEECSTPQGLAAATDEDDDWFADVDGEAPASPLDTPTAALEPALFSGLGDLERLGPAVQPDLVPAPVDAGADDGLTTWPEPDSRSTVAEALERVALRIRDGNVPLPSDVPSASEEAALAAVLAALLHSRSR